MARIHRSPCSVGGTRDGLPGVPGAPGAPGAPARFRWRGRPYRVSDVLCHWVESGQWWSRTWFAGDESRADGARLPAAADMPGPSVGVRAVERQVWRVEARTGFDGLPGVYDLVHEPDSGRWWVARVWD